MVVFHLYCGFYMPTLTLYVAIANVICRPLYAYLYLTGGSNNRYLAVLAGLLPIQGLTIYVLTQKAPEYVSMLIENFS